MANGKDKTAPAKPGRPSKLTPELQEAVCETCRKGIDPLVATVAQGVDEGSYYRWRREALDGEEPQLSFVRAVARACAEGEISLAERLSAGDGQGIGFGEAKASLEILQRRFPKRWSVQVKVEMADQLNRFIDAAQRVLEPASFGKLLQELAEEPGEAEAPGAQAGQGAAPIH